eukprot:4294061-Pleurochrysis_carterae.AAC.1
MRWGKRCTASIDNIRVLQERDDTNKMLEESMTCRKNTERAMREWLQGGRIRHQQHGLST